MKCKTRRNCVLRFMQCWGLFSYSRRRNKYGKPQKALEVRDVPKPVPKDDEVLIQVKAALVTAGDCEMRELSLPFIFRLPMRLYVGFSRPKRITVLGMEASGTVEAVGRNVTRFKSTDRNFNPRRLTAARRLPCMGD
ncbi:MAG: alcohol dehydrogenase catalytic domain-containing protein [Planctomycetota bacterium]